jgi:hypothetical protein
LLAALPGRLFASDVRRFALHHGFTPVEAEVLLWSGHRQPGRYFARADLVRTGSGFKLLELNVGGAVGGMAYASLPALVGHDQHDPPLRAWSRFVASRVAGRGRGAIVEDASLLASESHVLRMNAAALAEACSCKVDVVSQEDLRWTGDRLLAQGDEVGWVYPVISPQDVCANPASYEALRLAVHANAVGLPFDFAAQSSSSKVLLATLWELVSQDGLHGAEADLVRHFIPRTECLSSHNIGKVETGRNHWVLKPGLGFAGHGVCIGREMAPAAWSAELTRALRDPTEPYVVQEYCQPLEEEAIVAKPDGTLDRYPAHYVWGLFLAEGRACGEPVMRCRALDGSMVINYANGAAAGMLRLGKL